MKQFGIYISVFLLSVACSNQSELAQYDDDGIYARSDNKKSSPADPEDAYYFVDEDPNASGAEYYGSEEEAMASGDDYVPEAKSLPSESGRAYNNQRYNSPTAYSSYTSHVPITMRLGYSSFHSPYYYGGGLGVSVGYGYMDPWWGYYDPWNPWCRPYAYNRWNSWYTWNMWSPYGPYGIGYGSGYAMGYHNGYYHGINSNNWYGGESNVSNTYTGPRTGFSGGSFNSSVGGSGISPRGRMTEADRSPSRVDQSRGGVQPSREGVRRPTREGVQPSREGVTPSRGGIERPNRFDNNRRPANPDLRDPATRPDNSRNERQPAIRWNNGSRTPDLNNNRGTTPSRGYTPPSRNNTPPATRPSQPSRNFSPPSTPSRTAPSSPPPSRSGGSRSGGNRGGFR